MKYYLHDSNAFNDEKITELYMAFGYEGLGLFYTALERFASQEKPIKTEVIKKQLGVGKRLEKCWSFMEEIGIICSSNGESFNKELLKFSEKYQIKKEKNAKRVANFRARHENVTHYSRISNAPKVKESKVKESKYIQQEQWFEDIWSKYPNRLGKKQAHKAFLSSVVSEEDFSLINTALVHYVGSREVANGFIKHGSTWFNNWRDWIEQPQDFTPKVYGYDKNHKPITDPEIAKVLGKL